ncbi:MAG: tripartite tricarboxylate transporter substrate binding protein [Xanthobacteraceae bacterium]|jgi:tripartite-type tricarboxylate transporter receptor subunit TctC
MALRLLCWCVAVLIGLQGSAFAQAWPSKPIRVIIPFGAGSATDVIPRIVFEPLSAQLGQAIVVENRVGAGGTLGVAAAATAEADGYTLLAHSNAHTISPAIYSKLVYDPAGDFAGITPFGAVPNVLIISPSRGIKTIQELVAASKAKPGTLNYASVGVGSGTHFSVEKFKLSSGLDAQHIPYKGGPEALTDVIAGRVDFYFCPINTALPHIRNGNLIALVTSATTRSPELPDVPTTAEAGYKDADFPIWIGLMAPAKTSRAIVERLHAETVKAIQLPATQERLVKTGVAQMILKPAEFDARIRAEIAANGAVAKAAGIKPN